MLRTRRRFVASGPALAVAALVQAPARAARFEFKCATDLAPDHPSNVRLRQMWAAVERESAGAIRTQLFVNAVLGGVDAMFTQLRVGALDFLLANPGTVAAVVPAADIGFLGFAFKDPAEGVRVMAGPLGDYVRREIEAKGMYAFHYVWDSGMLQIGVTARPIRTPNDLHGLKLRVQPSKIIVDLFRGLGSSPTPISFAETYTALQTRLIDGESVPIPSIEASRFYEVQRFLSLTNHSWAGLWLLANGDLWKGIPDDLRAIVDRNAAKYAQLEARDTKVVTDALIDKLTRQGMVPNTVDPAPFRARLRAYYATWADAFGPTQWGLLQKALGRTLT